MSDDHPRRRRRSSISEHIQRVFSVDRSDKVSSSPNSGRTTVPDQKKTQKHASVHGDAGQPHTAVAQARHSALVPNSEITIGFDAGETVPSSANPSSLNSRLPSVSTPGSSPGVHPVFAKDESITPQQMASTEACNPSTAEVDRICSSPTWERETARKERRATKRLEAERKELEKRLSNLEAAQQRLEQGIYERDSRRLVKKQPLGSSKRSSSASSERPKSSSTFSFFTKRRSRSRASSVNGSDTGSRNSLEQGPPSLPLTLPEQFGTVVSRELATRHGTGLASADTHQMPRLHHPATKSDDLREHWKVAEAWKKKNGHNEPSLQAAGGNISVSMPGLRLRSLKRRTLTETYVPFPKYDSTPHPHPQATELSADLDRESFTAALRIERSAPGVASRPVKAPTITNSSAASAKLPSGSSANPLLPGAQQAPRAPRVNNAHHLSSGLHQYNSLKSKTFPVPTSMPSNLPSGIPKKNRPDTSPNTLPKAYKSSPLALNPFTNKDVESKGGSKPSTPSSAQRSSIAGRSSPIHSSQITPVKEQRAQESGARMKASRKAGPMPDEKNHSVSGGKPHYPGVISAETKENSPLEPESPDFNPEQMSHDAKRYPLMVPPLKHSGRRSTMTKGFPKTMDSEVQETPTIQTDAAVESKTEPADRGLLSTSDEPVISLSTQSARSPGHKRAPSIVSSHGSSYDTADEEVLDISKAHTRNNQTEPPYQPPTQTPLLGHYKIRDRAEASEPQDANATNAAARPHEPAANRATIHETPVRCTFPLAPGGPVYMMRKNSVQKVMPPEKDHIIGKVFVICCSCKYWHDIPSEIYARLACPEATAPESLLVRTFSRRKTSLRRSSLFSSDSGHRGLPLPLRIQQPSSKAPFPGTGSGKVASNKEGEPTKRSESTSLQCCWCGHQMTKTCCQGWTTLVQMRERYH